jgi:glycosyltransferase involved in cell wall biosynthesis
MLDLSVIIPTRNRSKLLDTTLESITRQTMDIFLFEVIVVDNASTDNTKEIALSYTNKLNIKYIYEPKPGLHEGRHVGLKNAISDILVYADDDIEAFPEWLETIYTVFQKQKDVVLIGGKNLPKFEATPPFWIVEMWNNSNNLGYLLGDLSILDFGNTPKEISPYYVFGCNFSIRKQVVIDAGGFHPDGMPFELIRFRGDGETYISKYITDNHLKAFYHPLASVYHWVPISRMTEDYFCKRRYSQGISDAFSLLRSNNKKILAAKHEYKIKRFIKIFFGIKQLEELTQLMKLLKLTEKEKAFNRSYQLGYDYLVKCYNLDVEVKNWILKENYL